MVAPFRSTIFVGKTFGGMTTSLIQAAMLSAIGFMIGIHYDAITIMVIFIFILLLSFALTSLGPTIGSYVESLEGIQSIVSFVVFPLYFLRRSLFPLKNLQHGLPPSQRRIQLLMALMH
jgi:ABC-2 type transport system permease protein